MKDLTALTTDELYNIAAHCRAVVSGLEKRGAARSVEQDRILKDCRAELRRVRKEIKARVRQLPLF